MYQLTSSHTILGTKHTNLADQSAKQVTHKLRTPSPALLHCGMHLYLEAGGAFAVGVVLQGPHLRRRRRHWKRTERTERTYGGES